QIPQFLLIGTSEILTSVTAMEFFYSQAPPEAKSTSAALNLSTTALGSWITIPLLFAANHGVFAGRRGGRDNAWRPWVPSDLNDGKLECYFLVLALLMALALAVFVAVASRYEYPRWQQRRLVLPHDAAATAATAVTAYAARNVADDAIPFADVAPGTPAPPPPPPPLLPPPPP
ncbi:unnamed protein product, partial [Phaeothamnion confervicola]